jgi:hypothetical protein
LKSSGTIPCCMLRPHTASKDIDEQLAALHTTKLNCINAASLLRCMCANRELWTR